MAQKIKSETNIEKEMILKAVAINEKNEDSFIVGHFYKVENINKNIAYNPGIKLNGSWYAQWELIDYFEIVDSLDDVKDLENKALILKETFEQIKEMSKDDEFETLSIDSLIQETINFLISDEKFQGNEIELRFICDNMDITMIEQCSCCGEILMPDDECYSDELNSDDAALCDHCSIFNEETNMYQKAVHKDVIEKITGLKFSPHIGNIGSKVEEFNFWLNIENRKFDFKQTDNKDTLIEFINEYTDWNICDCCGMIEISKDLIWDSDEVYDEDYQNFRFLRATSISTEAVCKGCINEAGEISKFSLEELSNRLKQNKMLFTESDKVLIENFDFQKNDVIQTTYFGTIKSINLENKTYTLEEYKDVEFKDEDFYDVLNEAYLMEYGDFISCNYSDLSDKVDEWTSPNWEGIAEIDYAFEEFGYKDEFIEHLKSKNLPYSRFLEPKFNIGDKFSISFSYYEDGEITEHIISKIDKSFTEMNEIVYWSDDFVYITESELEKQKTMPLVLDLIKDGMNRIEFSNSLQELLVGNNNKGKDIYLKDLNIKEKIYLLEAIVEDYKENL